MCSVVLLFWVLLLDLFSLVCELFLDVVIIGVLLKVVCEYELMEIGSYEYVIVLLEILYW